MARYTAELSQTGRAIWLHKFATTTGEAAPATIPYHRAADEVL
jgi:hypothetical protein